MEYRPLGRTGLKVSVICLGTMTYGDQNTEAEGHAQMDLALDHGINFFDTAEMYPVPPQGETYGRTEEIIGSWFAKTGKRDQIILASKVSGPGRLMHIRGGDNRLHRKSVEKALEDSLKRLKTDYIDLYQIHWPDRPVNMFGQLGYAHREDPDTIPLAETLATLGDAVKAGKIRQIGLSNETPWGVMECLRLADQQGLPRVVSIQNPYNLLNRSFEVGLAEMAIREDCGLLAYSPLAMGLLSGKYENGAKPAGARLTLYTRFTRYDGARARQAASAYVAIARQHGLDPSQMALAYVNSRPFVTSNIIGASTLDQLKTDIASMDLTLSQEVLDAIEAIQNDNPNPAP